MYPGTFLLLLFLFVASFWISTRVPVCVSPELKIFHDVLLKQNPDIYDKVL